MSKRTPGLWRYTRNLENTRWIIDGGVGHGIAVTAGYEPDNKANARLIAAAPELLSSIYDLLAQHGKPRREEWLSDLSFEECLRVHERARAAIAKATGTKMNMR